MNRQQRREQASKKRKDGRLTHRLQREFQRTCAAVERFSAKADDLDYIDEIEAENERLLEQEARFEKEIAPALSRLPQLPRIRDLEAQVARLQYQVTALESDRPDLRELPHDLQSAMELLGQLYPHRIVFSTKAFRSAESAQFQDPRVAWRVLRSMATTLCDLYRSDATDIEREFRDRTGFELALTEGAETRKSRRLRQRRFVAIDGSRFDISPHVKYGTRPPRLLRVHYAVVKGVIFVGHCGDHLPTAGSRRHR